MAGIRIQAEASATTYVYNESANTSGANRPTHLTGIIDEKGNRFTIYKYAADGRVISTERSGGVFRYSVAYNGDGTSTVTDPLSTARILGSQTVQDVPRHTSVDQPCDGCGLASSISYDTSGYLSGATNFNGIAFTYVHDARGLETSRTEASGTPQARTITTQWDASFRLPTLITEPGRTTSFDYDTSGNLLTRTVTDTALSRSRSWTHTYNSAGQVLSVNGPRTDVVDVTSYTYYANDDPDLGKRGNLASVTNALGHVTQITAYNAHGQPLTIVDPNGLVTELGYDARRRLTSRDVGGELTSYEYDGVGQLTKVTLPDGSFLAYTYDPAHRLTVITDALGNRVSYTLDAMGNRTQEQVLDPLGALAQTRSRVFNSLNRLFQEIGAQNQTAQYAYDNQGNVTSIDGPLAGTVDVTGNQYDALNRLVRVTDPASGQVSYGYNALDQLTSVTDPRSLVTSYGYNGLGDLNQQVSPDTGTTDNTYDAAGNLARSTDAKGQTATYHYDALNRVWFIDYADGARVDYGYDAGSFGKGRLTGIVNKAPGGAIQTQVFYSHDQKGRVIRQDGTIGALSYTIDYGYDSAGRLSTLASTGTQLTYSYDLAGRISRIDTTSNGITQNLLADITYHPFGGVKGHTLGNGQSYSRGYDQDGRIASYTLGGQQFNVGYDPASRISFIAENGNPSNVNDYGYDNLDRLTQAVLPNNSFGYSYDATGNRLSKTAGANTDTYAYSGTSNRLASITPATGPVRSYAHDANGSITNDAIKQYSYDATGRLTGAQTALGAVSYQVNALGQRYAKTVSGTTTQYIYDQFGRLLGETSDAGLSYTGYVWLHDLPVALLETATPTPIQYFVHPDHLNTPRLIANQQGQTVWRWEQSDPFGGNAPDENPSGLGIFTFNLRLPGQYFDKETNLHYNYFRDYDSSIGRYVQSDPVGMKGGLNTYSYALSGPLSQIDVFGLAVRLVMKYKCPEAPENCRSAGSYSEFTFGCFSESYRLECLQTNTIIGCRAWCDYLCCGTHRFEIEVPCTLAIPM